MHKSLSIALLIVVSTCVGAQTRGGVHGPGFGSGIGFAGRQGRGFGNSFFLGEPFSADYPSGSMAYATPAPGVVIVQPPLTASAPEPKPEPLMIEWQGDRFVRFGGVPSSGKVSPDYSEEASLHLASPRARSVATPADLPPAVLVFRDGHREEVSDYVIADGVLYARGDYARSGSWRRNIELAALDLPATLRTNQETGVRFVLPAGPNEVVTRP